MLINSCTTAFCSGNLKFLFLYAACFLPVGLSAQTEGKAQNYRHGLWAGISYNWGVQDGSAPRRLASVFGMEFRLKDTESYLALLASPLPIPKSDYYTNESRVGLSGELGLCLQVFSLGRFTGQVSKAYYGFDVRFGRQAFRYSPKYTTMPTQRIYQQYDWVSIMARVGWRFRFGRMFVDLALPLGIQMEKNKSINQYGTNQYRNTNFLTLPTLAAGFRF